MIEIFAYDKDFNLVTACVPYFNLQWDRKYYAAGQFEMQTDVSVYSPDWRYILTNDRQEVGLVQRIEYKNNGGEKSIIISGFFAEQMLNRVVARTRFVTDLSKTENVLKKMFEDFGVSFRIGMGFKANAQPLGDRTSCDFLGDALSDKWYSILDQRGLSYRVTAQPELRPYPLLAQIWQGVDRRQTQTANPWYVFSTEFGNITDESVIIDNSAFANVCYIVANDEQINATATAPPHFLHESYESFIDKGSDKPDEGQTQEEYIAALEQEGFARLFELRRVEDVDVKAVSTEGYMTDYDLGDLVTVIISDIGLTLETRIVEVNEVFKPEGHSINLVFGNKRITNIERALMR